MGLSLWGTPLSKSAPRTIVKVGDEEIERWTGKIVNHPPLGTILRAMGIYLDVESDNLVI